MKYSPKYPIYNTRHTTRPASPMITQPMWWMLLGVALAGPVAYLFALALTR
jgi:hypothetical protein